jgi:NADPH-dependent 2,4-dienoyl-CoA reductase/sulfur reductase-like enzyme/nitrite reductase/ring-hydroxylating ferredoxin subunit
MSNAPALTGPDLTTGIPAESLPEGGLLAGHAHGEPVLLARSGGEVFAVGALCTHYSAPLADGIVTGDQIRCPWHHSCFSLRTGEAVGPPALNPLPCWSVDEKGGRLFVLGKKSLERPAPRAGPGRVVIVGAGAAGAAAAEVLRREGFSGSLTLVSGEEGAPVDRPNLSKDYLAGTAGEDWVHLRDAAFYREQEVVFVPARADRIDAPQKEVVLHDGRRLPYDALLLATGAEPIRLNVPGGNGAHVHYLRSFTDSQRLIAAAGKAKCAVVVGASFIGLEAAASLRTRGIPVDVVAPETRPLERILGPAFGDFIRQLHEEHGVVFHLGQTVRELRDDAVLLQDGTALTADLVVAGIGVRPSTALAESAGCRLDRGVVVNELLETSVAGISVAGDSARWPDPRTGQSIRIEHWALAQRLGEAAARNILGAKRPFTDVPFFWSQHYDVPISYVGHAESWDRIEVVGSIAGKDCVAAYWRGNRIAAVASIYRDRDSLRADAAFEEGDAAVLRWWKSVQSS